MVVVVVHTQWVPGQCTAWNTVRLLVGKGKLIIWQSSANMPLTGSQVQHLLATARAPLPALGISAAASVA